MTHILQMTCPTEWDGEPLKPGGTIGLRSIQFNRSCWEAHTELSAITIPDGGTITIRRDGPHIYIERDAGAAQTRAEIERARYWAAQIRAQVERERYEETERLRVAVAAKVDGLEKSNACLRTERDLLLKLLKNEALDGH
jgi:hypothetical protein